MRIKIHSTFDLVIAILMLVIIVANTLFVAWQMFNTGYWVSGIVILLTYFLGFHIIRS